MDSSSIVKPYVNAEGSEQTREAHQNADQVATSLVAYAEVRAAFARMRRQGHIRTKRQYERTLAAFEDDWPHFYTVAITDAIIRSAGDLIERHPLGGYDAVHVAACLALQGKFPEDVSVSTWDRQLARAALGEGLHLAHGDV